MSSSRIAASLPGVVFLTPSTCVYLAEHQVGWSLFGVPRGLSIWVVMQGSALAGYPVSQYPDPLGPIPSLPGPLEIQPDGLSPL